MEQTQTSLDLQQHQKVSQLGSGSLSFSSEVVLPNIPNITTTSINSDSNPNQPSSLTMAVTPSIHSTPSEQGHAQSFSNYSAEALIGGNELIGDSVMTQESQLQSRSSRTTYFGFFCRVSKRLYLVIWTQACPMPLIISSRRAQMETTTALQWCLWIQTYFTLLSRMSAMMLVQTTHCAHLQPCQIL